MRKRNKVVDSHTFHKELPLLVRQELASSLVSSLGLMMQSMIEIQQVDKQLAASVALEQLEEPLKQPLVEPLALLGTAWEAQGKARTSVVEVVGGGRLLSMVPSKNPPWMSELEDDDHFLQSKLCVGPVDSCIASIYQL